MSGVALSSEKSSFDGGSSVNRLAYTDADFVNSEPSPDGQRRYRPTSLQSVVVATHSGPYTPTVQPLITNKRARKSSFMRRLAKLDREAYERCASVGAQGEPVGDFSECRE